MPDISTGGHTRGLLAYLYGPGRRDEHTDPHIVAAWDTAGAPDPGRDDDATLTQLAQRLDMHVLQRARRMGGKMPAQHVWHCPVRTAPEDRYLTDDEWAEVARRVVQATGIDPKGDGTGCRWIAVRHDDNHIHIVATTVLPDGRRARRHGDGKRAQAECRKIEYDFGLRRLKSGDDTAAPTPKSAERAKAERRGAEQVAREELREYVRTVVAVARDEAEFFSVLGSLGIQVKLKTAPETGDVMGYAVALKPEADDTNAAGEPIFYGGSRLAPDLSLPKIRKALAAKPAPDEQPAFNLGTPSPLRQAETALRQAHADLTDNTNTSGGPEAEAAQGQIAALGAVLDIAHGWVPDEHRAQMRAAAKAFERATRSRIHADHQHAAALRDSARQLLHAATYDTDGVIGLLGSLIQVTIAARHWYTARRHEQQAAAAEAALAHLQPAYRQLAQPRLRELARRAPSTTVQQRLADAVRAAVPEHAERILTDPAWPALATVLAKAQTAGHQPYVVITEVAGQRELDTASWPAETLLWRIHHTPSKRTQAATRTTTTTPRRPATTHPTAAATPLNAPTVPEPRRHR